MIGSKCFLKLYGGSVMIKKNVEEAFFKSPQPGEDKLLVSAPHPLYGTENQFARIGIPRAIYLHWFGDFAHDGIKSPMNAVKRKSNFQLPCPITGAIVRCS